MRQELKSRVRGLESAGRYPEASDLFRQLLSIETKGSAGVLWHRLGDLHAGGDQLEAALAAYERALELYLAASQPNNAIAICRRILALDGSSTAARARLADLAIASGLRTTARDATRHLALDLARGEEWDRAVAPAVRLAVAFPGEPDFLSAWLDALAGSRDEFAAAAVFRQLADAFAGGRLDRLAAAVRDRIPAPSAEAGATAHDVEEWDEFHEPTPTPDSHDLRLEGFEPTHPEAEWIGAHADSAGPQDTDPADEPLPLLRSELMAPSAAGVDAVDPGESGEVPEEEEAEPLPFLPLELKPAAPERDDSVERTAGATTDADPLVLSILDVLGDLTVPAGGDSDPATHYDLGLAHGEMGSRDLSLAHLAAAVSGGYNPLAVLEVLGETFVSAGEYATAIRLLGPAVAETTLDSFERLGVLYWLGRSQEALGDDAAARDVFERVVRLEPSFRDASERVEAFAT
jgi:tetratricopeptide (TPR) repeat protein